jgi:hypothetical protein
MRLKGRLGRVPGGRDGLRACACPLDGKEPEVVQADHRKDGREVGRQESVRAAVHEELFYRGFAIERLAEITGLLWLAGLISVVAFTYAHLSYWGWAHLIVAGYGGLVLTVMYLWRRDLASNMIAHFLTDAVGFLLGAV